MDTKHRLVIAVRPEHAAQAEHVERELRAIKGVSVIGAFRGRFQADASDSGLAEIRRRVGNLALIEEQKSRGLPE